MRGFERRRQEGRGRACLGSGKLHAHHDMLCMDNLSVPPSYQLPAQVDCRWLQRWAQRVAGSPGEVASLIAEQAAGVILCNLGGYHFVLSFALVFAHSRRHPEQNVQFVVAR